MVSSDELLKKGPLYINVFSGICCPNCNIETLEIESYAQKFRDAGASIVAISPEIVKRNNQLKTDNHLSFDLLSDFGLKYGEKLGLKHDKLDYASKDTVLLIDRLGIDIVGYDGYGSTETLMPTKYVVNQDGEVVYAVQSPNHTIRPEPSDALAVVKSLK